jgi:hypothetical protein
MLKTIDTCFLTMTILMPRVLRLAIKGNKDYSLVLGVQVKDRIISR